MVITLASPEGLTTIDTETHEIVGPLEGHVRRKMAEKMESTFDTERVTALQDPNQWWTLVARWRVMGFGVSWVIDGENVLGEAAPQEVYSP